MVKTKRIDNGLDEGVEVAVDELHGFPVIASFVVTEKKPSCGRPYRIVIVDRCAGDNPDSTPDRFVAAHHCLGDREWFWGSYCRTLDRALEVFNDKIASALGEAKYMRGIATDSDRAAS